MLRFLQFNRPWSSGSLLRYGGLLLCLCLSLSLYAGSHSKYNVQIDFKKAYISGICIMLDEDDMVKASIVNEFGVSALDFTYNKQKKKVKIISVMSKLDHWYIRRVLKADLKNVMVLLPQGINTYNDEKFNIRYTFNPINETEEQSILDNQPPTE